MKEIIESRHRKSWWVVTGLVCVGVAALMLPRLAETTSPVDLGVSQPPLVTIIFDSSGSMQWTEEGQGQFPRLDSQDSPDPEYHYETWRHGQMLGLPGSRKMDGGELDWAQLDYSTTHGSKGAKTAEIETVGPCIVWGTEGYHEDQGRHDYHNHHGCENYSRPASCSYSNDMEDCEYADNYSSYMRDRLDHLVNDPDYEHMRLSDDANTPRHIQVKQILTGDMQLAGDSAPGCWFVPRARGAMSEEQICCPEVDEDTGRCIGDGSEAFERYIDYDDPVPHYQEIYDNQSDGLLDGMASTALFSAAMFDGYRVDGVRDPGGEGWQFPMRDIMVGSSPYTTAPDWHGEDGYTTECQREPGTGQPIDYSNPHCYDMGIFRFAGPTRLTLDEGDQIRLSGYVQEAILDAGFLQYHRDPDDVEVLGGEFEDKDGDSASVDDFVFQHPIGQQPMAQASPFGPVFHDLHQFYIQGQYDGGTDDSGEAMNPSMDDPYMSCRGRHAVLFTDGIAEPEAPGGAGGELGSEILQGGGFGYLPEKFPYVTAEEAIGRMVDAVEWEMRNNDDFDGDVDPRHLPRVHIIGAGMDGIDAEDMEGEVGERALQKMAAMAEAGRTCAQAYLPANRIPVGEQTGDGETGTCDPEVEDWCLVKQNYDDYQYESPTTEGETFTCRHPAVVLSNNDREAMRDAFVLIFNEIAGISGLAARTRPAMTSYLDDDDKVGQYRIFSGLEVGGNYHWKGLLRRQLLACNDQGVLADDQDDAIALHDDFSRLLVDVAELGDDSAVEEAKTEGSDGDRRRIFTSAPRFLSEGYNMELSGEMGGSEAEGFFFSTYSLMEDRINGDNIFDGMRIVGINNFVQEDSRIPFDFDSLEDTMKEELEDRDDIDDWFADYWNVNPTDSSVSREDHFRNMIDEYRGRTADRADRVLGAIYNANPVAVGPPDLDLPIDSYRDFRREYSERPTMLYATTVDGQLRAIYAGEPEVMARRSINEGVYESTSRDAQDQREAWAYIPQLLHRDLTTVMGSTQPDGLMDGSPVVRDVRLCQGGESRVSNARVCPGGGSGDSQWRTVLVQGMGMAGSGYFALDVTRSGGSVSGQNPEYPDPIVMWEFGPEWETMQAQNMPSARYGPSSSHSLPDECENAFDTYIDNLPLLSGSDQPDSVWDLAFLGTTVGEPAIGSVNVRLDGDSGPGVQRPVAVVGGGTTAGADPPAGDSTLDACTEHITGRAIYVIDLQSGEMIRRFVEHTDDLFPGEITGTPVLSASNPGDVSTRGFVGDEHGNMFRIDMSNPDPGEWQVKHFFDPETSTDVTLSHGDKFGPAAFRPAVTVNNRRELVVIYGLGQRGDTGAEDTEQAVIAIRESFDVDPTSGDISVNEELVWATTFQENERLTGEPIIFNNDAYFTTYVEGDDRCMAGYSRIYRMAYNGDGNGEPLGRWNEAQVEESLENVIFGGGEDDESRHWFQPTEPTLIRGMAITMGPACNIAADEDTLGQPSQQQPQLVAQTGGGADAVDDGGDPSTGGSGAGGAGEIGQISVDLEAPDTQAIPLSWSVLQN